MRIDLGIGNIAASQAGLSSIAGGFRSIARAQERVAATAPKFVAPTEVMIKRASGFAGSLREVAAAYREIAAAQKGAAFTTPARAAGLSGVSGDLPTTAVVNQRRPQAARAESVADSTPKVRFIKGPEQRRAEIAAQREQLSGVADPAHRGRIGKDLDRADFLAQRSITLHQRRMQTPEESLNRPGLLELFGDLNRLLKDMAAGNVGAVVKDFALGMRLIERPGGLNISQKLGRTLLGGAPVASSFNPEARGAFNAADLAAGHAGIAAQLGKAGGGAGALGGVGEAAGSVATGLSGIAAAAGPFIIALAVGAVVITAAFVAVKLLSEGVKAAVRDLASFREAMQQSGGTSRDVAQLSAFGIAPDQIAGMASSFRDKTAAGGDVAGQIGRARLGLGPVMGGPFGPTNEAGDLVKAIEGLRKIADPNERLRVARMTGLQGALPIANASQGVFSQMKQDASVMDGIRGDKRAGQDSADLQANGQRLFANAGGIVTAAFKPFIAPLNVVVGGLANIAREGARYMGMLTRVPTAIGRLFASIGKLAGSVFGIFDKFSGRESKTAAFEKIVDGIASGIEWLAGILEKFADGLPGIIGGIAKSVKGVAGLLGDNPIAKGLSAAADQVIKDMDQLSNDSARRENTKAIQKLTGVVEHASGTFGGGARARSALGPSAVTGEMRRRAIEAGALGLGYWTL